MNLDKCSVLEEGMCLEEFQGGYFNSQPKKLLKIFSEGNEPCQKQIKAIKIYTVSHFVLL